MNKKGFGLVELMIAFVALACIMAAVMPVLGKKLIKGVNITRIKQLETTCDKYFGPDCRFCESDKQCLVCTKNCLSGEFLDAKNCTCSNCKISNCDKCNNDSCAKCNSGYYLEDNICKICPIGYICDGQNKTLCPAGTYQNEEGKNQCKDCEAGYKCSGGSDHSQCEAGYYSLKKASKCLECQAGFYSGVLASSCIPCNKGTYNNIKGSSTCTECPLGNFCLGEDHISTCSNKTPNCTLCDPKDGTCSTCKQGYYLDSFKSCSPCTIGAICDGVSQTQCPSGTYIQTDKNSCTDCPKGSYCPAGTLKECPIGQYQSEAGKTTCLNCPKGYYQDETGKTTCKPCPANTYQNNTGQKECKSCPEGQYQDETGKENCKLCSEKFANCSICNANECLECNEGMELANGQCREEWCKGANFMKIQNLCFTRRNMGDSAILTIPDSIKKIEVNESLAYVPPAELQDDEICYTGEKCCFWGETSRNKTGNVGRCDSITNGSYSGCNRTVCNHFAAQEICSSFKYKNKNWRLPKESEVLNLINYSSQLKDDGLMLCSYTDAKVTNQTTCPAVYNCRMQSISELNMYGGTNFCRASNICLDSSYKQGALYFTDAYNATDNKIERNPSYHGFSVRCVTEI